jgi:hypothetical protein
MAEERDMKKQEEVLKEGEQDVANFEVEKTENEKHDEEQAQVEVEEEDEEDDARFEQADYWDSKFLSISLSTFSDLFHPSSLKSRLCEIIFSYRVPSFLTIPSCFPYTRIQ